MCLAHLIILFLKRSNSTLQMFPLLAYVQTLFFHLKTLPQTLFGNEEFQTLQLDMTIDQHFLSFFAEFNKLINLFCEILGFYGSKYTVSVFWAGQLCGLLGRYYHSREKYYLHLQGITSNKTIIEFLFQSSTAQSFILAHLEATVFRPLH